MIKQQRESNLLATRKFISFVQMKNWKRTKKNCANWYLALKIQPYVQTNDKICLQQTDQHRGVVQPCISILNKSRCIFALLHATDERMHRSARYDSACQFSPRFFSPWLPAPCSLAHTRSKPTFILDNFDGCFWRFSPATDAGSSSHARTTPRRQLYDTFFILYEFFPPRTYISYHAPLTTAMSIIRIFRRSSHCCRAALS